MIDPKLLRTEPDLVRASLTSRGEDPAVVDELLAADEARRSAIGRYESLRAEQKGMGKQVAKAQGDEKAELLARTKELAAQVKQADADSTEQAARYDALMRDLPNLVLPGVPLGGEDEGEILETIGEPRDFAAEGITVRDHLEIGAALGAIDMERGAKVSGSRFYILTGIGAELELALLNLAMATALGHGFTPVIPPALVRPEAMDGTGFLGQAAQDVYHLPADDLYLVGTSEVALAAMHADEILDAGALPIRYAGYSPCFRREAGSHGKDTRGIFRVHWFDKVEMFVYCDPADAEAQHDQLLEYEKDFLRALEIPFQVLDVASGDLGQSAARKYDCYSWVPSQQRYREITSTSNCTEYQARRLNIRARFEDGTAPVATLNGTLCAMTRTIIAILENHQQADGTVRVPAALRPYLEGVRSLVNPAEATAGAARRGQGGDRERAESFGAVAGSYERLRPGYPDELFDDLLASVGMPGVDTALEVGAGTGRATVELVRRGIAVDAIEPSDEMAAVLEQRVAADGLADRVTVRRQRFEDLGASDGPYRLVVAAQSFHWADPATRWARLAGLLHPDGVAALFWNGWSLDPERHDHDAVRSVHQRCAPDVVADLDPQRRADPSWPVEEIAAAPELDLAGDRTYPWRRELAVEDYLGLLATTSQYIVAGQVVRSVLFDALRPILGDRVHLSGRTLLVGARRSPDMLAP